MAKLSGRLQQLRELRELRERNEQTGQTECDSLSGADAKDVGTAPKTPGKLHEILRGWEKCDNYVWRRQSSLDLRRGRARLSGILLGEMRDLSRLTFYDFETTGISGGAGTIIFLAGFGVLEENRLTVDQVLLTDYPGEAAFLNRILPFLGDERIYVSYNGKSFDRSILQNRLRMKGLREEMPLQLDLLYPSRRLWSRVLEEGCGLQQVERNILELKREGDIAGALIPQCYQNFIRGEGEACMGAVIEHHLQDIVSLAELLFFIESLPENPELLRRREEKTGMAILLMGMHDPGAVGFLEDALSAGDETAGRYLAGFYKKTRDFGHLEQVLERMLDLRAGFFQVTEMAKLLEHQRKLPGKALEIMDRIPVPEAALTSRQYENFRHRRKRLEKKSALQP